MSCVADALAAYLRLNWCWGRANWRVSYHQHQHHHAADALPRLCCVCFRALAAEDEHVWLLLRKATAQTWSLTAGHLRCHYHLRRRRHHRCHHSWLARHSHQRDCPHGVVVVVVVAVVVAG